MSYFITGTDTGVGKTVVTAGLAALAKNQGKSVCVYKPLQTGSADLAHPEDPEQIASWLGQDPIATFCSYNFHPPVAPYVADSKRTIRIEKLLEDFQELQGQYDVLLVEGAGGVRVPIAPGLEMRDLIEQLNLPVILVARPNLGTMNHTLLSVEALRNRNITVRGVVVSGYPDITDDLAIQTLPEVFQTFLPVPVLGYLPPLPLTTANCFQEPAVLKHFAQLDIL